MVNLPNILRKIKNKIVGAIDIDYIKGELSPEREEALIDKVAIEITKRELEVPAILFFSGLRPISGLAANIGILPVAPLLENLGLNPYEYVTFLQKRDNVRRILDKIEYYALERKKKR